MTACTRADLELRAAARAVADRMRAERVHSEREAAWESALRSALDEIDRCLEAVPNYATLTGGDLSLRFAARTIADEMVSRYAGPGCPAAVGEWRDSLVNALRGVREC